MKNPKILPFGDWFKVYEKAGSNFNKTQRLLESEMLLEKDSVVRGDLGIKAPAAGADLKYYPLNNLANMNRIVGGMIDENDAYTRAIDKIKNFGSTVESNLMPSSHIEGTNLHNDSGAEDFLANLIAARAIRLGKATSGNIFKDKKIKAQFKAWVNSCVKNFDIQRSDANDLKLTPDPSNTTSRDVVYTIGMVAKVGNSAAFVRNEGENSSSKMELLSRYINVWNFLQWAKNGNNNARYDQESIKDGYFDLQVANGKAGVPNEPTVLFYADQFYERATAERGEKTDLDSVGGVDAAKGQADIAFPQGSSVIENTEIPKIQALADVVKAKFGKDQTVDNFELISSASPEWFGDETMADYEGMTTTGIGDPGPGSDFATNNFKLAYDRGVSFMNKLNELLKGMGHPGFNNYSIKWQVSDQGPGKGRYVDLQIERNYQKPKVKATTTVTGTQTSAGGSQSKTATLYAYKFVVGKGASL